MKKCVAVVIFLVLSFALNYKAFKYFSDWSEMQKLAEMNQGPFKITNMSSWSTEIHHRHHPIQNVKLQTLLKSNSTIYNICQDKEYFLNLFIPSSFENEVEANDIIELCTRSPTYTQMITMYGPKPVVIGLETCQKYQQQQQQQHLYPKPRVAGLYNSGTNALERLLQDNFERLRSNIKNHSPYRVPWGKHLPPNKHRLSNRSPPDNYENPREVLPIVIVRDPFFWMQSMCKQSYDVRWSSIRPKSRSRTRDDPCPHLVRKSGKNIKVWAKTEQTGFRITDHYTSLIHMWQEWHQQYINAKYPRIFVRHEDVLYRAQEVYEMIEPCFNFGNKTNFHHNKKQNFMLRTTLTKNHGEQTALAASMAKYATTDSRYRGLTLEDRKVILQALDHSVVQGLFQYSLDIPTDPVSIKKDMRPPHPQKQKWMI